MVMERMDAAFQFAPGRGWQTSGAWRSSMDNMFNGFSAYEECGYHYLS